MDDKTEELIALIAKKHGIALDETDPIMVVPTLLRYLLDESQEKQGEILDEFKSERRAKGQYGSNGACFDICSYRNRCHNQKRSSGRDQKIAVAHRRGKKTCHDEYGGGGDHLNGCSRRIHCNILQVTISR